MKTPEEIKKGMYCCSEPGYNCNECPYVDEPAISFCKITRTKDALEYIQQLEAQVPHWISVEERLPEPNVAVLTCATNRFDGEKEIGEAWHNGLNTWEMCEGYVDGVTHWMPMPEPPKER